MRTGARYQDYRLMSTETKNKIVPKLRFLEFKDSEKWIEEELGLIGQFTGGGTPSKANESFWEGSIPWVSSSDIDEESVHQINITRFISEDALKNSATKIVPANSILLVSRVGVGKLAITRESISTSQDFTNFTPDKDDLLFLAYYLKSLNKSLFAFSQGMAIKGFTKDDISKLKLFLPSEKEQQKIADCLSSLDDLITSHNQKLEALQAHKKGLIQQLFPAEGETVPKLRFEEFRDSGGWGEKSLGQIGEPLMCKRIFKEETTDNPKTGIPFYKIGTFGRVPDSYISKEIYEEYKSKYSFPKIGDILISASGTIGRLVIYDGAPAFFQDSNIIWLGHNEEIIQNRFLFYCYSTLRWQTSDGGVISRLYNSDFKGMIIHYPINKKEQKKIADFLSSLDELITAQTEKIEGLQKHKKGLMQGLFPNTNEIRE